MADVAQREQMTLDDCGNEQASDAISEMVPLGQQGYRYRNIGFGLDPANHQCLYVYSATPNWCRWSALRGAMSKRWRAYRSILLWNLWRAYYPWRWIRFCWWSRLLRSVYLEFYFRNNVHNGFSSHPSTSSHLLSYSLTFRLYAVSVRPLLKTRSYAPVSP